MSVVTNVLEKGMETSPKPIDLSDYSPGEYSVEDLDPDGTIHVVGKVTLKEKKGRGSPEIARLKL